MQTAFAVLAIAAAGVLILPKLVGWEVMTVLSGSMDPTYPTYSVVVVAPTEPSDVEVGDVIAFQPAGADTPITHRVVEVNRTGGALTFVTKGDGNEEADQRPVLAGEIRGRVTFGVPVLGRFVDAVRSPLGFAVLFALPCAVFAVQHLLSVIRTARGRGDAQRGPVLGSEVGAP
jgi:signal peptidase